MALLGLMLCLGACAPRAASQVERGRHLARALGCGDCHAPDFTGHKVSRDDSIAVLYSANLTRAVAGYSDAELRGVITTGLRPDGTRLWRMGAAPYAVLSDADLADLTAFLRSLKPAGQAHPRIWTTPAFDALVRDGEVRPESLTLAQDLAHPPAPAGPGTERGRYLARTLCAGCHTPSLRGDDPPQAGAPPDLAVAAAYGREDFRNLLRDGRGPGGRDVGEMGEAARARFAGLPVADVDALYDYLAAWGSGRK